MESSIPAGAAKLLDLIGDTEAPRGYDTVFGNHKLPQKLTTMTVSEVIAAGPAWSKTFGSSAAGRYQFMNATLKSLKASESLTGKEKFDPDLQDLLGYALLDKRGYEKFSLGKLSVVAFGLALAKEWASFPVLTDCHGAHRMVKRGETYYAGDRLNKALISPEKVEAILTSHKHAMTFDLMGVEAFSPSTGDAAKIPGLVAKASDTRQCGIIRERGKEAMIPVYGKPTVRNACAATLCCFLDAGGIDVPMERDAGDLAKYIEKKRGWKRISVGSQQAGDIAVCFDKDKRNPGADHIFLVVKRIDNDEMLIADNQTDFSPHTRFASGYGHPRKTPVEYFLRASSDPAIKSLIMTADDDTDDMDDEIVWIDQPTNNLVIRFDEEGNPL